MTRWILQRVFWEWLMAEVALREAQGVDRRESGPALMKRAAGTGAAGKGRDVSVWSGLFLDLRSSTPIT
jgi:hypothetical protein